MVQMSSDPREDSASKASRKQIEILEAASRVFRKRGLHAAGMREIAAECGMQVGNLYYYFESKQDLLAFCQSHTLDDLLELTLKVEDQRLPSDTGLYLIIVGHVVLLNQATPGSLAHLEVEALDPDRRDPILRRRDLYESAIRSIVHQGVDTKIFRPADPKVVSMALLGAVNWTVKWFEPTGTWSSREIGEQFADLLVSGLLHPGRELLRPRPEHLAAIGI